MNIEPALIKKFAAIYAEAVLTWLDSGEPQWLLWDGESPYFDFVSAELGDPEMPIVLGLDERWSAPLGDVGEVSDPESEDYDPEALREAIEVALVDEGHGERILKIFLERLDAGEEGEPESHDPLGDD
jgi:hypothetical protein